MSACSHDDNDDYDDNDDNDDVDDYDDDNDSDDNVYDDCSDENANDSYNIDTHTYTDDYTMVIMNKQYDDDDRITHIQYTYLPTYLPTLEPLF